MIRPAGTLEHPGHRRSQVSRRPAAVGEAVTGSSRRPDGWFELIEPGRVRRRRIAQGNAVRDPGRACGSRSRAAIASILPATCSSFDLEGQIAGVRRDADHGQGPAQGKEDGDRLARAAADPEPELDVRLRAAERGPGRAGSARSAAGAPCRPAVGDAGDQSVHRPGRAGAGRGAAAGR